MRTIALIKPSYDKLANLSQAEIRELNIVNFTTLLKLWKLAFPLLHHQQHTYYFHTPGNRPTKNSLTVENADMLSLYTQLINVLNATYIVNETNKTKN